MTVFAQYLGPVLRDGFTVEHARDVLWSTNSPELWDLLVTQRGWTAAQFGHHLTETLIAALLATDTAVAPGDG